MTPTLLALIGGLLVSLVCFIVGGLTTYAGYKIFGKSYGNDSSRLDLKLWGMEASVGNVGGVIMISGLAWGVIGYSALPDLNYTEENGSSSANITMAPAPVIVEYELELSSPSDFMESNAETFNDIRSQIDEFSSSENPADLNFLIAHKGIKGYSPESFVHDYLVPVSEFCESKEGKVCRVGFTLEPGFEDADEGQPFTPTSITLSARYR